MKFLDYAGVQRLWNAMRAHVATRTVDDAGYLTSADPNVIVTHEFTAGVADTALAAIPGESNVIKGFVSGEDAVLVPLALIRGVNPDTVLTVGALDAARFSTTTGGTDMLLYTGGGVLSYCDGNGDATAILTLDGAPTLAAGDILIGG